MEAFPRGGSLSLVPLEYRDVVEQATKDALIPIKPSKRSATDENGAQKKQRTEDEPKAPNVEYLTFKV